MEKILIELTKQSGGLFMDYNTISHVHTIQ